MAASALPRKAHWCRCERGWFGVCFYWEQPVYLSLSILLSFARKEQKPPPVHIKRVLEVFPSSHSDFKWSLRRQYTMEELRQKWQVRRSAREWHLTPEDEIWSILPHSGCHCFQDSFKIWMQPKPNVEKMRKSSNSGGKNMIMNKSLTMQKTSSYE